MIRTGPARFGALMVSIAVAATAAAAPSDPLIGLWRSKDRGGIIELHHCGTAICGRVLDGASLRANPDLRDIHNGNRNLRTRRVKGLRVFDGFTGGPRQWKGGALYDPETGLGTKSGYLTLKDADTLEVKGCALGFLCQSEIMLRVR